MKKSLPVLLYAFMIVSLFGCTIDISQPGGEAAIPVAPGAKPTTAAVNWSDLNLKGRLVYSTVSTDGNVATSRIQILDLASGEITTIFSVTGNTGIYYLAVSPDEKQLIISYIPPSQPGSGTNTALYVLPLDGKASPQILFAPLTPYDSYTQVEWSPDGKYIYFVNYNFHNQPANQVYPNFETFRMPYPDGQPQKILDGAFWPRLSADSSKLVYVSVDPVSGVNKLFRANADGTNPQEIKFSVHMASQILDAPIFLPDGETILFSSPTPAQAYQPNWLDRLMGVQPVEAHSIPSDWWSVPIGGGAPKRLTHLQTTKLFASISPDKQHIVSVSRDGIFVMDLDGSHLTQLLSDSGISGTVNWIP